MTKSKPKEERIQQIIDNAVLEFIEKGYEGTSMESIARRAGLSKGGLYYHFNSKDEILIEANNRFMQPVILLMEKSRIIPSPTEGLRMYIKKYLRHWTTHTQELTFSFLSIYKLMSYEDIWPEMETYTDYIQSFFKEMLSKGIASDEFREHDSDSRALAMMASLDGITPYIIMSRKLTISNVAESFIQTYITEIEVTHHE